MCTDTILPAGQKSRHASGGAAVGARASVRFILEKNSGLSGWPHQRQPPVGIRRTYFFDGENYVTVPFPQTARKAFGKQFFPGGVPGTVSFFLNTKNKQH